ncbi:HIT family protein [Desulfogranum japonicum]|uniref:HIT family protein n=1 Tax=Desulfogranum japonicum TaxID=231447 RepID=UPI00041D263E|nr:HIT domain-containing protein [Desulfogranum japonicum]
MEHVTGKHVSELKCIFEPPGDSSQDRKFLLLFRDQFLVILLNRFPYANGHLLVAPSRHVGDQDLLTYTEQSALMWGITQGCKALRNIFHPDGLNVGLNWGKTAGAGIADHLHYHIVPRWEGDHNFMTVCADIRTIPQHIDTTFDLLLPEIQQLFSITPY